jgi:Nickel responsive protein SCO4226-like
MPLFIDIHRDLPAHVDAGALADAHRADVDIQDKYGAKYLSYWFDEDEHVAFCLVEAPDAASAAAVHRESHGLVADEIHGVVQG